MIDPDTVPTAWMDTNGVAPMTLDELSRHIPPEVVRVLALEMARCVYGDEAESEMFYNENKWQMKARAALAAGLAAWPRMHVGHQCTGCGGDPQIILPLPQEGGE